MKTFFRNIPINHLVLGLSLCLFFACKEDSKLTKDHLVFRYNEHANISSLDPAFAKDQRNIWACNQLYNSLVRLNDSLQVEPDLAKTWNISEDQKTYTFFLQKGVFFHQHPIFGKDSTRAFLAKDVVYSFNRLRSPKIASPGSWVMQSVEEVIAVNDSVVKIRLKEAFPAFLGLLSMKFCSVVPTEMENLDFRSSPIGTGPFYFKRWKANEKLVFRKNKRYFEKDENGEQLPYLEAVAITFLPDKQSEFLQFIQGNLDFLSGLDPSYKDEIITAKGKLRKKHASKIAMQKTPYLNTEYLGIFLEGNNPALASAKIRKAINIGFDRQKMVTYLRNGIGIPANYGFIPKGLPGFSDKIYYTYQPEKAKALVTAYRKETGKTPQVKISTNASYLDLCEYIQQELRHIGIQVEIEIMTPSTLRQQRSAGKLESFRASWIADYPDAENYLSLFYSKNFSPNGPNYTHFSDSAFDALYEKAKYTDDRNKRQQLYKQMDAIIMDKAPIVPLYYDEVVRFKQSNVQGLGINPINLLNLSRVKKIPEN